MITPIEGLRSAATLGQDERAVSPAGEGGLFADVFESAIRNVRETDAEKTQAEYLLATGQLDNPAIQSIASSKYQIAAELLIQLRNKALESYSELMRISL